MFTKSTGNVFCPLHSDSKLHVHFIHYSISPGPLSSLSSHLYSRARSFPRAGALVPFIFVLGNIRPRYLLEHQTSQIHRLDCIGLGEFGVRRRFDYDGVRKERLFSWGASFEALFTGGQSIFLSHPRLFSTLFQWLNSGTSYVLITHHAPDIQFTGLSIPEGPPILLLFFTTQMPGQLSYFPFHTRQQSGQVETETPLIKRHWRRSSFTRRWLQKINKEDMESLILWNTRFSFIGYYFPIFH